MMFFQGSEQRRFSHSQFYQLLKYSFKLCIITIIYFIRLLPFKIISFMFLKYSFILLSEIRFLVYIKKFLEQILKFCQNTALILLSNEEVEKVGEGNGVLCRPKKFDVILVDLGQSRTLALYQPSKLVSISGTSYILSMVYEIVPLALKFPLGV